MKETGILYTSPMVRAILAHIKTMTRRVVNPAPMMVTDHKTAPWDGDPEALLALLNQAGRSCPYGQPGGLLRVKETFYAWGYWEVRHNAKKGRDEWHFVDITLETGRAYRYAADGDGTDSAPARMRRTAGGAPRWWKRPAIFMPRVASRITLEITKVRVERLQDISEADAKAEGLYQDTAGRWTTYSASEQAREHLNPVEAYRDLWESINGPDSWDANPWVWVISFKLQSR